MVKKRRTAFKTSRKYKISKRQTKKNNKFGKQKGGWIGSSNPKKKKKNSKPNMKGGFWGGSSRFYTSNH